MTTDTYDKLVPEPTQESAPYWDGLNEGRLLLQKCGNCGKIRHYPRSICDACYSSEVKWIEASGHGKVHSWTITHHPFHPGYVGDLPYTLVTVDLDEGVRMQAQLRADKDVQLRIDLPVRVQFERVKPDLTLPAFVVDE